MKPIRTPTDHQSAVAALVCSAQANPALAQQIADIEQVLRYELQHSTPEFECLRARLMADSAPLAQRIAIISDIHGNHAGLMAALDDIAAQHCDRVVCLGDLVEGGPDNEQVIATLKARQIPCVCGNHDEINDLALSAAARQYLSELPPYLMEGNLLFVHISPRAKKRAVDSTVEAWNVLDEAGAWLSFVGHVHVPRIFSKRSVSFGEATLHPFEYNQPLTLDVNDRYVVCVGAIGYGRDQVGRIRYCIFDRAAASIEVRSIAGPLLPLDYALRQPWPNQ